MSIRSELKRAQELRNISENCSPAVSKAMGAIHPMLLKRQTSNMEPDHLVVALLQWDYDLSQKIRLLGVDVARLITDMEQTLPIGKYTLLEWLFRNAVILSPQSVDVFALAAQEAKTRRHRQVEGIDFFMAILVSGHTAFVRLWERTGKDVSELKAALIGE